MREALTNALAHRDYSAASGGVSIHIFPRRLEIHNSGCLPEGVTTETVTPQVTGEVTGEVCRLVQAVSGEMTRQEIQNALELRHEDHFRKAYLIAERLEKVRERHEQGLLNSLDFLKTILQIAKEVVEAENQVDPEEEQDRALAALTDLFNEVKSKNTHVIVERIVADIDGIVKQVRFPGWQGTSGERVVQQALRRALLKYKLHTDQELFDKAYGYIRQYY